MSDTSSNYDYIENTGVIVPDTSTLLLQVISEFQGAYGTGLSMDASTPQGVLGTAETIARANLVQNNAKLANQINPNQSGGIFLDAICAMTGLTREPDTYTVVEGVILAGVQGSPIAAGTTFRTAALDQFALNSAVELDPITGTAVGTMTALVAGPVPCGTGAGGIVGIVSDVLGLETVSTPQGAVITLGTAQQPDELLRALRRKTLALQSVALNESIVSHVNVLPGVVGCQFLENYESTAQTISGIPLKANSIWLCIDGGNANDIGQALLANKSGGCNWNGAQSVTVTETASGQAYTVNYDVPTLEPIVVQVTCKAGSYVGDPQTDVPQAVLDFAAGNVDGYESLSVGQSVSPFDMAGAIKDECPGIYIKSVQLSLASNVNFSPAELAMALNQKATVTFNSVSIVLVT